MNNLNPDTSPLDALFGPCLRGAALVALVTGLAYPLLTIGVAQLAFPQQANGSLMRQGGGVIGSALIGQAFVQARYFHPRPSATSAPDAQDPSKTVSAPYNAALSSGSNLGPTSQALITSVALRATEYRKINGLTADIPVPVDAVTASGSGLDPHISVANARAQAARVAQARGLDAVRMIQLIDAHTEERLLGLLGEPRVNVLRLNMALDSFDPTLANQ